MPLNNLLEVEVFGVWGIQFIGPFCSSMRNKFTLVIVDYMSKWIEVITSHNNDARAVIKMFRNNIFPRFSVPRLVISDDGSHLISKRFENLLRKYGVRHILATPYHPQTSEHVEI